MNHEDPSRRDLLKQAALAALASAGAAAGTGPALAAGAAEFDVEEATLDTLRRALDGGRLTARRLAELYLQRIDALDRGGPRLNSVIEVNPDALEIAAQRDAELAAGRPAGPLHGIPVLIKDNIDTADRMKTTAGSLALAEGGPKQDATVAARLRAAGAVILGKTNLSEWANFRSTRSTSGWSGRGGLTRNPYALDRNACGSSTGSGVAAAASLCALAVGTETDGSIVCPAHHAGLVGIKPTVGLVSRAGIIPISASQDTAGPMARSVADAAFLLSALAGVDPRDAATTAAPGRFPADAAGVAALLDPAALKGARLGVARNLWSGGPGVAQVADESLAALKAAGAVLVDPADLPHAGEYDDAEFEVLLHEFKDGVNAYLASLGPGAPHRTLADLIAYNDANRAREMPYFGQELFVQAEAKGPLTSPAYQKALATCRRLSRKEGLDALFARHRIDALVYPTGGPAWLTDLVNGDHYTGGSSTPAAVSGYPALTVPAGVVHGLPVGMTFVGRAWSEPRLVALGHAFEQTTKARRRPRFLPTVRL